ncbi:nucleoside hydrolase [Halobacillus ihumii]|uniref:nucleoside hydrolase n=1 Tax=Halobacillus ihumii TaxID=2686092 RepID=UPI001F07EE78|nr:nucleoside hydrolase [Halobacillus ihumii]
MVRAQSESSIKVPEWRSFLSKGRLRHFFCLGFSLAHAAIRISGYCHRERSNEFIAMLRFGEISSNLSEKTGAIVADDVAKIVGELLEFFASTYKEMFDFDGGPVHDVLTVAYCIAPELFKTKDVNITVETKGELTSGTTLVDVHGVTGRKINARFGLGLDVEGFWELMIESLKKY